MPVYVQHEVLGKVNDVFNAEALWQAPGLALFSRRPLLRDLLERSPREFRGREPIRCFSHVTLMLAQEELDDDRHLTRGARVRDLTSSLKALHQRDFGDLLGGDEVRYDVRGTEQLEPGEVEVCFGHAVYLPVPGESVLYQVSTSLDGEAWQNIFPIYLNQRLSVVGHEHAGWPFSPEGTVLLVNDGPDAPIEVQVRPRNALECRFDAEQGLYVITARHPGFDPVGKPVQLLLRVEKVARPARPARPPAAVWKVRNPSVQPVEQTAVPLSHRPADATCAPQSGQRASLVGLALPRLSRYHETGVTAMEIGLDDVAGVAIDGSKPACRISIDAQDQVALHTADGTQVIQPPCTLSGYELKPVAAAMADRYCAMMSLPAGPSVVTAGAARLVFGRGAPALSALRVLDSPRFLSRANGPDDASADRLGLSRNAFSFEPCGQGYRIVRLSPTQALYHLDEHLGFVASIDVATADAPYLLPNGHHLVAGHYIIRFEA